MKASRILITVVVLMGIWGIAYTLKNREKTFGDEARKEAETQKSEVAECKTRLQAFHKAWADFRKTHKGGEPAIADFAKYIKEPEKYVCPTAARWAKLGKFVQAGSFEVGDKKFEPTYGFLFASSQGATLFRRHGDKAPLVICTAHSEGLYRAGYKRGVKLDTWDEENRAKLISEVAAAKDLVVQRNGSIEEKVPGIL
jgi:hypothetical protein